MSSNVAAGVRLSWREFSSHGGKRGPHADGWGIAYYEGADARVIREPSPAAHSACVHFLADNDLQSELVISHIRRASQGGKMLANTQPFARELHGRLHVFAHNGDLALVQRHAQSDSCAGCDQPIGQTDSELAFCILLGRLTHL